MTLAPHDAPTIMRFTAEDTDFIDRFYGAWADMCRHDDPEQAVLSRDTIGALLARPPHGTDGEFYAAMAGDRCLGNVLLFFPTTENTHTAFFDGWVYPDHRRGGVGRRLFDHVRGLVRERGRTTLLTRSVEKPGRFAPGPSFLDAMGMAVALTEIRRRQRLADVDDGVCATALADCWERAADYELVQWADGVAGPVPETYVDDLAVLHVRLDTDAPRGDLATEPRRPDPEEIRAGADRNRSGGFTTYNTAVRHVGTGRIVAWTSVTDDGSDPKAASQGITVVDPDHRGRRLGTLVKLENLAYLRRALPELEYIDTSNADENAHMIAINEAIGYREHGRTYNYQMTL